MNFPLRRIKPLLHVFLWIFLVVGGWFLWSIFLVLNIWSYILPLILGLGVGILSGLPPPKAFLACFCGFFILALLSAFSLPRISAAFILFGFFSGLVAVAGAVIRRIVFRRGIEELYLTPWEWVLLIGGISLLSDYMVIPCAYTELFIYHRLTIFSKFFICSVVGLFLLGIYAGVFYCRDYNTLIKSVGKAALAGHTVFLLYRCLFLFLGYTTLESFLLIPLTLIFLAVVLIGTKIGYTKRGNLCDGEQST